MIRLELPYPVSANRYWRTTVAKGRAMTFVSTEAKAFKRDVGWLAKGAGLRQPFECPVELRITLTPKNGICMDLDNALKVSIDALKGIAYVDDAQVRKITAERTAPDGKGGMIVEVDAFADERVPQLFPVEEPPEPVVMIGGIPADKVPF